ncbi:hypothetical protein E4U60_003868 [Claviceps pazoutovae]|uniref:Uncharacterized protein n=1 Tax=Claviceps pazoutovae TaxID=1649127 RepID=A0A9P7MIN0_9HYPO|nr:hypothetical protein E4U60_003868 [Claviceps pazoutovae]
MKFSIILGTFALSALEVNRALASPLEPVSPGAQSLEERDTGYCCFQIQGVQNKFVPNTGGDVDVATFGACTVSISRETQPRPSQDDCKKYLVSLLTCPSSLKISVAPAPAVNCKH